MKNPVLIALMICLLVEFTFAAKGRTQEPASESSSLSAAPKQDRVNSPDGLELSPGKELQVCKESVAGDPNKSEKLFFGHNAATALLSIKVSMLPEDLCIPKPVSLAVPNTQKIQLTVKQPIGLPGKVKCSAVETVKQIEPPDLVAILVKAASGGLPGFKERIIGAENPSTPQLVFNIHPIDNAQATITVSCSADKGNEATVIVPKKTIVITYQNIPLFSASAGTIVSLLGKQTYGIVTTPGSVTSGAVTSQYTIGVTSSSTTQFVPIGFLDVYGLGTRDKQIDFQAGLGINPNGSKTRVEYFLGPAFDWKRVFISPGLHIAQAQYLANGYKVGETVSSQSFAVPTTYKTTLRFGISISYSPKLPSSSASK